jgi:hypothetical protein
VAAPTNAFLCYLHPDPEDPGREGWFPAVSDRHQRHDGKGGEILLYIGHFSFDEKDGTGTIRHGYFTCIVGAVNPDAAVPRLIDHILALHKTELPFTNIVNVYLEDLIQVPDIPSEPIVTRVQSSKGKFPDSISYSLPSVTRDRIEAFGLRSNVRRHESKEHEDRFLVSDPLITFDDP